MAPRAPLGVPVWKPFLNLRATVLRYLMRPVPTVFLRLAFSDQLSVVFYMSALGCFLLIVGTRIGTRSGTYTSGS